MNQCTAFPIHGGWSVFAVRLKTFYILGYPQNVLQRLWSDCADAQADPSLRFAQAQYCRKFCDPAQMSLTQWIWNRYNIAGWARKSISYLYYITIQSGLCPQEENLSTALTHGRIAYKYRQGLANLQRLINVRCLSFSLRGTEEPPWSEKLLTWKYFPSFSLRDSPFANWR